MRNVVRVALGLSIIAATLAVARPASARFGRWVNFVNRNRALNLGGPFFMGVAGNCNGTGPCTFNSGTRIIVWANGNDGKNHDDQKWTTPDPGQGQAFVTNLLPSTTPQQAVLSIQGPDMKKEGQPVLVRDAVPGVPNASQMWEIVPAEAYGATTFAGCFVFRNVNASQVAGVAAANLFNGASVIQWPLFVGTAGQSTGWHPDQFWCPVP